MTAEEEALEGVKDAEAEAKGGTEGRRLETGGKLSMSISVDAKRALENLRGDTVDNLVQLVSWTCPIERKARPFRGAKYANHPVDH